VRVLVTGGRDYANQARLNQALDCIHAARPITVVIHGDSRGADRMAAAWARQRGIPDDPKPADWDNIDAPGVKIRWNARTRRFYNANAGFQRNIEMLERGDVELVIAFAGGNGTQHCVRNALKRGIAVMSVDD
jgi:hypothetical protein